MAAAINISWTTYAWEDYLYWQETDEVILGKINSLLKECVRTPFTGRGKPEPLKGDRKGFWSRRITQEHRFIYKLSGDTLYIAQCRFHYDDK